MGGIVQHCAALCSFVQGRMARQIYTFLYGRSQFGVCLLIFSKKDEANFAGWGGIGGMRGLGGWW
jgi:hypothetical protein